jgi:hypothetical protein
MPMVKGAPIYGTYGGHYEETGDGDQTWVPDGPGQWVQDDNDVNWVGDKYITGYEPDVFVPDTPPDLGVLGGVTSTPPADTTVTSTPPADTTPDLGTLGGVTSTPPADTTVTSTPPADTTPDLGTLGGVTSTPPGKPIYATEPKPEQTEFGDGEFGYESSYTTGYFGEADPDTGDQDWIGKPTDEIIGYEPTADPAPTTGTDLGATTGTDLGATTGTGTGTGTGTTDIGALANISPSAQYVAPQSNIQNVYGTANMPEHRFFSYGV